MLAKQVREKLEVAIQNGANVKIIRNTAANGDDYYIPDYVDLVVIWNGGSYTQSVYLPPVAGNKGRIISIVVADYGGGGTIADQDDSLATWTDLTNNADSEFAVIFNTGVGWATLVTTM